MGRYLVIDAEMSASLEHLKSGYIESDAHYTCLLCGEQMEKGVIYPVGDRLYDAHRYTLHHIQAEHGSVFSHLVQLDKAMTGLSDIQRQLLTLFYEGKSDAEIQKAVGVGSTSTVRNHRFILKEKERQARLFLAIMELLHERQESVDHAAPSKKRSRPRAASSNQDKVLAKYFPFGPEGPLQRFTAATPLQHKRRIAAEVAERFHNGRRYTEKEVNQILEPIAEDHVLLRRCLVDFGHLNRLPDGSQYWRAEAADQGKVNTVDRRKELKRLARETKTEGGVFQICNTRNGKVLVHETPDLKTMNGQRFQLEMGSHVNRELQQEWNEFGGAAFVFEVLEVLEEPETGYFDKRDALKKLKEKWLEKLQPFGEQGYNSASELAKDHT